MQSLHNLPIDSESVPRAQRYERSFELVRLGHLWRATFSAMGSPCELLCETRSASEAHALAETVAGEAWRIEDKFSRYIDGNIVDRINSARGAGVVVDDETAGLIDFANLLYGLSGGRFDITSGVLRRVWTFDGSDNIPQESAVLEVMQHVGWDRATWRNPVLSMPAGMQIDFGGIGKEYAVDRAVSLLRGQSTAACLVNFGGDLAVTGQPTSQPGWLVGREALQGLSAMPGGVVRLAAGALATSGDTRRFLVKDGVRYAHILDPTTGWPVLGAPASVTVAAETCVQAGMLCTLAMLKGGDAESFLDEEGVRFWCQRQ
ncbi:MAG: FAD:protein FMN transferase [Woeseiaceae bacterium]|nr:FAD:protein FMN transferase [Woeseiaceae bacterium]